MNWLSDAGAGADHDSVSASQRLKKNGLTPLPRLKNHLQNSTSPLIQAKRNNAN